MEAREIVKILDEEINLIKKQTYPQDLETTVWVAKRIEALDSAIDIILATH